MGRKIKKHSKSIDLTYVQPLKKPILKSNYKTQSGDFPLNKANTDRINFSVLRDNKYHIVKIENISYEIYIDGAWEWIVRYDDHDGTGPVHRHLRVSLKDDKEIESATGIKKYRNKDHYLNWACKDIKRLYLIFRKNFIKANKLKLWY